MAGRSRTEARAGAWAAPARLARAHAARRGDHDPGHAGQGLETRSQGLGQGRGRAIGTWADGRVRGGEGRPGASPWRWQRREDLPLPNDSHARNPGRAGSDEVGQSKLVVAVCRLPQQHRAQPAKHRRTPIASFRRAPWRRLHPASLPEISRLGHSRSMDGGFWPGRGRAPWREMGGRASATSHLVAVRGSRRERSAKMQISAVLNEASKSEIHVMSRLVPRCNKIR